MHRSSPTPHSSLTPRVCHCALRHVCMCAAVVKRLFRVMEEKSVSFCCDFVMSTCCPEHMPSLFSTAGSVLTDGAACSRCQVIHGRVWITFSPQSLLGLALCPITANTWEKTFHQNNPFLLIRGCREGVGVYTGFYCHLKSHICHCRILYCMLKLEF